MSKKHQYQAEKDENGEKLDPFHEILQLMDEEQLIRFRKRLEMVKRKKMIEIFTAEIEERKAEEKKAAEEKKKK
jgi:hypothetical protein